jgi:hypothetical protein
VTLSRVDMCMQLLEQIVKKDPIPDIQNYLLWFDELHTYLQHDQPLSVYQIPHQVVRCCVA